MFSLHPAKCFHTWYTAFEVYFVKQWNSAHNSFNNASCSSRVTQLDVFTLSSPFLLYLGPVSDFHVCSANYERWAHCVQNLCIDLFPHSGSWVVTCDSTRSDHDVQPCTSSPDHGTADVRQKCHLCNDPATRLIPVLRCSWRKLRVLVSEQGSPAHDRTCTCQLSQQEAGANTTCDPCFFNSSSSGNVYVIWKTFTSHLDSGMLSARFQVHVGFASFSLIHSIAMRSESLIMRISTLSKMAAGQKGRSVVEEWWCVLRSDRQRPLQWPANIAGDWLGKVVLIHWRLVYVIPVRYSAILLLGLSDLLREWITRAACHDPRVVHIQPNPIPIGNEPRVPLLLISGRSLVPSHELDSHQKGWEFMAGLYHSYLGSAAGFCNGDYENTGKHILLWHIERYLKFTLCSKFERQTHNQFW